MREWGRESERTIERERKRERERLGPFPESRKHDGAISQRLPVL